MSLLNSFIKRLEFGDLYCNQCDLIAYFDLYICPSILICGTMLKGSRYFLVRIGKNGQIQFQNPIPMMHVNALKC